MTEGFSIYGVEALRDAHPAIKGGKEEHKEVPGSLGTIKHDAQRLFHGPGTGGMGSTSRFKNAGGGNVNKATAGSFKVRKRK